MSVALIRRRYVVDGGAERFIARALDALKNHEVKITLITREWQRSDEVEIVRLRPFHIGRLWRNWSFDRAVKRFLKKRHFDLVQSHERIDGCDIYRAGDGVHREWLVQRGRILPAWRRILTYLSPYHWYVKRAERRLFVSVDLKAVICISQMVKDEIQKWFSVPTEKLHVIYNGVNLDEFHPNLRRHREALRQRYGIPVTAPLYLFVGSGFERKGLNVLLDAAASIPEAWLLIVGRDKRIASYERRARHLGVHSRTVFAGSQADVKPYYGAADVFVFPTLYEPFGNVVLEAMASGLPVITSNKCGGAEVIEVGRNGYVCDALDTKAIATAMQAFISPEQANLAGRAARVTAENFSFSRMANEFVRLYETVGNRPA